MCIWVLTIHKESVCTRMGAMWTDEVDESDFEAEWVS